RASLFVCSLSTYSLFFLPSSGAHRALHSFPTRRSSDLAQRRIGGAKGDGLESRPIARGQLEADMAAAADHFGEFRLVRGEDEDRSEEHTSELQSRENLVCRLLLEKKKHRRRHMQRTDQI